jgi:hypothetical protein
MDKYELLDRSPALRWVLRVWNGVCAAGALFFVVVTIALAFGTSSSDSYVDVSGALAGLAFMLALAVAAVWAAGRGALLLLWRAGYRRGRQLVP